MLQVLLLCLFSILTVLARPQEGKDVHIVFSEAQPAAPVPVLPEPRSGVAYVFSVPVTNPPQTDASLSPVESRSKGEAAPLGFSDYSFKEVTVSKKVAFRKEEAKSSQKDPQARDPLDPAVNES